MRYRAEIDGLRALAVIPVILYHAGFQWLLVDSLGLMSSLSSVAI